MHRSDACKLWSQTVQSSAAIFEILDKWFQFSEPQFPIIPNRNDGTWLLEFGGKLNETMYVIFS